MSKRLEEDRFLTRAYIKRRNSAKKVDEGFIDAVKSITSLGERVSSQTYDVEPVNGMTPSEWNEKYGLNTFYKPRQPSVDDSRRLCQTGVLFQASLDASMHKLGTLTDVFEDLGLTEKKEITVELLHNTYNPNKVTWTINPYPEGEELGIGISMYTDTDFISKDVVSVCVYEEQGFYDTTKIVRHWSGEANKIENKRAYGIATQYDSMRQAHPQDPFMRDYLADGAIWLNRLFTSRRKNPIRSVGTRQHTI